MSLRDTINHLPLFILQPESTEDKKDAEDEEEEKEE